LLCVVAAYVLFASEGSYSERIHLLSTGDGRAALVCNVQLTEFIIVFPSNEWLALTRAGRCVVYIVDYPACSIRFVVFTR